MNRTLLVVLLGIGTLAISYAAEDKPVVSNPVPQGRQPEDFELDKQASITWANRAPNSKDKGSLWVYDSVSTVAVYARSRKSGTWVLIGP